MTAENKVETKLASTWENSHLKLGRNPNVDDFTCVITTRYKRKNVHLLGLLEIGKSPKNSSELLIPTETWPPLDHFRNLSKEDLKPAFFISLWNFATFSELGLSDEAYNSLRMWEYNQWVGYTFFKSLIKKGKSTTPYGPRHATWVAPGDLGETGKIFFYHEDSEDVKEGVDPITRVSEAAQRFADSTRLKIGPLPIQERTITLEVPGKKRPKILRPYFGK